MEITLLETDNFLIDITGVKIINIVKIVRKTKFKILIITIDRDNLYILILSKYLLKNMVEKINEMYYYLFSNLAVSIELLAFCDIPILKYFKFDITNLNYNYYDGVTSFIEDHINNFKCKIKNIHIRGNASAPDRIPSCGKYDGILPYHIRCIYIIEQIYKEFYNDVKIYWNYFDILKNYKNNVVVSSFIKNQIKTSHIKLCSTLKSEFENDFDEDMYLRIKDYLLN